MPWLKPFFVTKIALMLYLASFIVLADSMTYVRFSGYIGIIAAMSLFAELSIRTSTFHNSQLLIGVLKPTVPYLIFVGIIVIYALLFPLGLHRAFTLLQLFILLFIVYYLVRQGGETWFMQLGFLIGILYVTAAGSWHLSAAAETGARFAFDPTGSGTSEDSLNPNRYALYLNLFILLSIKSIFIDFRNRMRSVFSWVYVVGTAAVCLLCAYQIIFATGSRKGIILLFLLGIGSGLVYSKGRLEIGRVVVAIAISLLTVAATAFYLKQSAFFERFVGLLQPMDYIAVDGSMIIREAMIREGFFLWWRSPIWGTGIEGFRRFGSFGTYSHSNYIEMLANHGLIGLISYYAIHVIILVGAISLFKNSEGWTKSRVSWIFCGLGFVLFWDIAAVSWISKANIIVLGIVLGYLYYLKDCHALVRDRPRPVPLPHMGIRRQLPYRGHIPRRTSGL